MHIEILLEEPSAEAALKILLPKFAVLIQEFLSHFARRQNTKILMPYLVAPGKHLRNFSKLIITIKAVWKRSKWQKRFLAE